MITEDEAMRLLERADPARVDEPAPFVDAAGYLAALRTRSTTVTLIDTGPTPTRRSNRHLWLLAAAAAVVAVVVGGLVLATRDDDPNGRVPAATTVAPDSSAAAESVVRGFLDAYVAGDADRAVTYLADDFIASDSWGCSTGSAGACRPAEAIRGELAWNEAARYRLNLHECERHDDGSDAGIGVRCGFDFHEFGSDTLGVGPYGEISWDFTVRDGRIVAVGRELATNQSSSEMWEPFANWIRTEHPDDVLVMYWDSSQTGSRATGEAFRLWEQRTQEFVEAVLTGPETYAAEVGAICATMATQLDELAVPAAGALDQVAAWNTAAAAIMDEAHGELIAVAKPPRMDAMAYTTFYGRLVRLAGIAEELGEAATAGDAARVAELDAEHRDIRDAMSSGPAGSGLEECVASLPS